MVSAPIPASKDTPCPDCGLLWDTPGSLHCQRAAAGSKCGVEDCGKRPLTECFIDGVRVATWCPVGGHRWRKPE